MITTVAWDTLYKCSKAGEREVYKSGFVFGISFTINSKNNHLVTPDQ
jgi:hypothetical protein